MASATDLPLGLTVTPTQLTITAGQTATFTCSVTENVDVGWTGSGLPSNVVIERSTPRQSILTITEATVNNSAIYMCWAMQAGTGVSADTHVILNVRGNREWCFLSMLTSSSLPCSS